MTSPYDYHVPPYPAAEFAATAPPYGYPLQHAQAPHQALYSNDTWLNFVSIVLYVTGAVTLLFGLIAGIEVMTSDGGSSGSCGLFNCSGTGTSDSFTVLGLAILFWTITAVFLQFGIAALGRNRVLRHRYESLTSASPGQVPPGY